VLTARVRDARVAVVDKAHAVPVLGVFLSVLVWGIGPVLTEIKEKKNGQLEQLKKVK